VLILSAEVESVSAGTFKLADPTPVRVVPIIPTVMQPQLRGQLFEVAMKNPAGVPWESSKEAHRMKYANGLKVYIQCIDASGNHWEISNEDDPRPPTTTPTPPGCDSLSWPQRDDLKWLPLCVRGCAVVTV
jgi:hypothetical protein